MLLKPLFSSPNAWKHNGFYASVTVICSYHSFSLDSG